MTDPGPQLIGTVVPALDTERLRLRPLTTDDLDPVHGYLSRPDVCRFLLHEPRSREQVAESLARAVARTALAADGDGVRLAVIRRDDDQFLGEVVLMVESAAGAGAEIGWVFHPDHAGRGYATEAARTLLDFAFEALNAHRVIARLHPDNEASIRLCRRLGLRQEAHHVGNCWIPDRGVWEDTGVFAILRREWAGG
ncbi:GNAT family N-acetyltransferase [Microlunatus speluncae]|uniref:GNAT family N-acetyltransferase n=1 Tax=Microlunatus speluncae TaxID=2594267 RepID=UPI001266487B|nr:GNAT family N-acetyltransferase [Microlunatus speluncae]